MWVLPTEVTKKLLGSYSTFLLRRLSSQVYFTDFTYIFHNICSISFCTSGLEEETTEKSAVESIVLKVTVLLYNLSFT